MHWDESYPTYGVKPCGVGRCSFFAHRGRPLICVGCGPGRMTDGEATGTHVFVRPSVIPPAIERTTTALPIHPRFAAHRRAHRANAVFLDDMPAPSASKRRHA